MCSFFEEGGITSTTPTGYFDLSDIVNWIRTNPQQRLIETIRELKSKHDDYYKVLKRLLSNITPQAIVKERSLKDDLFDYNFISFTKYFYFDIDDLDDVDYHKKRIIEKYADKISLITISPSGTGLSLLFKVRNKITRDNFELIWNTIRTTILVEEDIDKKATGIGRAMYLTYDPDVYVNYENSILVDLTDVEIGTQVITKERDNNYLNSDVLKDNNHKFYNIYNLDEILSNIILETYVPVNKPVVEFKEVLYVENFWILYSIADTKKHQVYYRLIHHLYFLNPDVEIDYIFSYLLFINNNKAQQKMEFLELARYFTIIINHIKRTGIIKVNRTIRRVHFNRKNRDLTGKMKQVIANQLNSKFRRLESIQKINCAIEELDSRGEKITNRAIAVITGLNVDTIGDRRKDAPIDMDYEVSLWN